MIITYLFENSEGFVPELLNNSNALDHITCVRHPFLQFPKSKKSRRLVFCGPLIIIFDMTNNVYSLTCPANPNSKMIRCSQKGHVILCSCNDLVNRRLRFEAIPVSVIFQKPAILVKSVEGFLNKRRIVSWLKNSQQEVSRGHS